MSVILFIIALVLVFILGPVSFVLSFFYYLITLKWKKGIREFERFSLDLAVSLDQFGNVVCKNLFSITLTKGPSYTFGNPDETVSFVIAINKRRGTLNKVGIFLGKVLDFMDKDHLTKAIEKQKDNDRFGGDRYQSNHYN